MNISSNPKPTVQKDFPLPGYLGEFRFTTPNGVPTWGWNHDAWFNKLSIKALEPGRELRLTGDIGDPRAGTEFGCSLGDLLSGHEDSVICLNFNKAVLEHMKEVAQYMLSQKA